MKIVFLGIVTGREHSDAIMERLSEQNAHLVDIMYSRDYVKASTWQYAFGLVPDDDEVMISCIVPDEKIDTIFDILVRKYNFDDPLKGIAYTVAIDKLSV